MGGQIRAERICVKVRGTVENTLKQDGTGKSGGATKILKRGSKLGQEMGALKGGAGTHLPTMNKKNFENFEKL